jgi:hypothetical protein
MNLDVQTVIEKLKAELGNLVYQLAVKEVIIEELQKNAAQNNQPAADKPA